jgi:Cytidylate kinase-like family
MAVYSGDPKRIIPGTYPKIRPDTRQLATRYIKEWEGKRLRPSEKGIKPKFPPSICFSRKVGVGALEIALRLAEKTGYTVVDKEILEYIADEAKLSEKTVALFDERYPGRLSEFTFLAFGEKAFIESDYTRHLFSAVISIGGLGTTIFVGRGTHLVLPRNSVLAVRFISSKEYRIKYLAAALGVSEKEAEAWMDHRDRDQRAFFKKAYGKKDASPYEFDLVINCDFLPDASWAAEIVERAFKLKFGSEAG